jgi:hypothetical protein
VTFEEVTQFVFVDEPTPLDPHRIGSVLSGITRDFKAQNPERHVMRMCSHNLLIVCTDPTLTRGLNRVLHGILTAYPGRTVVAVMDPALNGPVQGAYKVFTRKGMLAGELIALHFPADGSPLPSLVSPLWVDGLPIVTVWRGQPAYGTNWFMQLVENASRLVIESGHLPCSDLSEVTASLRPFYDLVRDPYLAPQSFMDFSWGRLAVWRDWTASLFDPPERRPLLRSVECVEIEGWSWPGETVPGLLSLYMAGWLVQQLGWKVQAPIEPAPGGYRLKLEGREIRFYCRTTELKDQAGRPVRLTFRGEHEGERFNLSVERSSSDSRTLLLGASGPGCTGVMHVLHLQRLNNQSLMGKELETDSRDPQFERVLETVLMMTGALQGVA